MDVRNCVNSSDLATFIKHFALHATYHRKVFHSSALQARIGRLLLISGKVLDQIRHQAAPLNSRHTLKRNGASGVYGLGVHLVTDR